MVAGEGSLSLSLSFRNGLWHPSSRKFVMGEWKALVPDDGRLTTTGTLPHLERNLVSWVQEWSFCGSLSYKGSRAEEDVPKTS